MNIGGYLPSRKAARLISSTFTDTEVNNCFSIYHTSWITSGVKSNFICENVPTKAILLFFGCSEVNSTWLTTSELANQRERKVLFTCVVYMYTNSAYSRGALDRPGKVPLFDFFQIVAWHEQPSNCITIAQVIGPCGPWQTIYGLDQEYGNWETI